MGEPFADGSQHVGLRVAGPALLERGLELIGETIGPVDILVNNAGIAPKIALKKDALDRRDLAGEFKVGEFWPSVGM